MNEPVVLDACVLVSYNLRSVLLTLAEEELPEPRWSERMTAAIASNATIIVTANLDDFPVEACSPYGVVSMHPEQFLLTLLGEDAPACVAAITRDAARRSRPPMTTADLLAGITGIAPTFADTIHPRDPWRGSARSDLPA